MKTKKIIKVAATVLFVFFAFNYSIAKNTKYSKSSKLKSYLQKHIAFPYDSIKEGETGLVIIDFSITNNGKIEINQINYSDPELKEIVLKELEQLGEENGKEFYGKSFIYKFQFVNES